MRFIAALLLCPFMTGCLALAFPEVDITPRIDVGDAADIKAVRIETTNTRGSGVWLGTGKDTSRETKLVDVVNGVVNPQINAKWCYWFMIFPVEFGGRNDLELVLERPGYERVIVNSWPWWIPLGYGFTRRIEWKQNWYHENIQSNAVMFERIPYIMRPRSEIVFESL